MITRTIADESVANLLRTLERAMDLDGSALPWNKDRPPHQLVIVDVQEHDFGWVYIYNSKQYAESGNFLDSLAGNAPVIVARDDGQLYATGTVRSLDHYLEEFRAGIRSPMHFP